MAIKFTNIQLLRAIAANGVLLSHLLVIEQKYGHGFIFLPEIIRLGSCGVDLFFVISGFIMATIAHDISWRKFLFDRITRIFPPYWFYTTIVLFISLISPNIVNSSFGNQSSLWRSYLLIPDIAPPLLAVGWTLIHEMYFYLCFAFIIVLIARFSMRLPIFLLFWAAFIVGFNSFVPTQKEFPIITIITHPLTLEFIIGAFVGVIISKNYTVLGFSALASGIIWLAIVFMLPDALILADNMNWKHIVLIGIPCALIVYGVVAIELHSYKTPKWLVSLGDASYSTYLSHVLVLSAIGRLYKIMPIHNQYIEILFVIICVGIANICGVISYRIVERKSIKYIRKKSEVFAI